MKIVEFKDYDNQTTPLSAYNLNRLQQNLITTKYQMTFSSAVSGGSTITLPCYYQVGQDTLDVYLNSELLKKASTKDSEGHYYEVGNSDTKSNQIKITSDWSIASGDVLNLIVRGTTDSYDQNLSPDKATQLADEISANKEEITALQTENSRLKGITNALPKISGEDTSLTLTNTANAPLSDIILKGNTSQNTTTGKNFMNLNLNKSISQSGITYNVTNDGIITINGTATSTVEIVYLNEVLQSIANQKYSLDFIYISGTLNGGLHIFNQDRTQKWTGYNIDISGSGELTNKSDTRIYTVNLNMTDAEIIRIDKDAICDNLKFKLQFNKGDADYIYEPYTGGIASPNPDYPQDIKVVSGDNTIKISNSNNTLSQSFPISLGSLELCKIGNYQDYFYKESNKWYLHKEIGSFILNGNVSFQKFSSSNSYFTTVSRFTDNTPIFPENNNSVAPIICTHFDTTYINDIAFNSALKIGFSNANTKEIWFGLPTSIATKVSEVQNWLNNQINNGNPVVVRYALATQTDTEIINTTLISQLNALYNAYTYNDTTNITQTNANLPFYINAEAFKKIS